MRVYDEITERFVSKRLCTKAITDITSNIIVFGYISKYDNFIEVLFKIRDNRGDIEFAPTLIDPKKYSKYVFFSTLRGKYFLGVGMTEEQIIKETHLKGNGNFPYSFARLYEAVDNFELFAGKQFLLEKNPNNILGKNLKYSFGLEFETSQGYIPEDICFRDGLIPLRDGSIAGLEYSTVVLKGVEGIAMLKQQLQTLKRYTSFDKECSLHLHFGNFPLNTNKLFNLYYVCYKIENDIQKIVPYYTFNSSRYKANEKDYCKVLPEMDNFNKLYEYLVGRHFMGDFTQPHPNDVRRSAKWRIPTR